MGDLCFCNGMLVYNIGDTKIQSLESWIKTYKGFGKSALINLQILAS